MIVASPPFTGTRSISAKFRNFLTVLQHSLQRPRNSQHGNSKLSSFGLFLKISIPTTSLHEHFAIIVLLAALRFVLTFFCTNFNNLIFSSFTKRNLPSLLLPKPSFQR